MSLSFYYLCVMSNKKKRNGILYFSWFRISHIEILQLSRTGREGLYSSSKYHFCYTKKKTETKKKQKGSNMKLCSNSIPPCYPHWPPCNSSYMREKCKNYTRVRHRLGSRTPSKIPFLVTSVWRATDIWCRSWETCCDKTWYHVLEDTLTSLSPTTPIMADADIAGVIDFSIWESKTWFQNDHIIPRRGQKRHPGEFLTPMPSPIGVPRPPVAKTTMTYISCRGLFVATNFRQKKKKIRTPPTRETENQGNCFRINNVQRRRKNSKRKKKKEYMKDYTKKKKKKNYQRGWWKRQRNDVDDDDNDNSNNNNIHTLNF